MIATERHVRMAAQLYEARKAAKTLLGEAYKPKMADLGAALNKLADAKACSVLQVAIEAARDCDSGYTQIQILAAAVELTEPSA